MLIQRLELVGYKRLALANIHRITYTPTSIHQLIIGTNGSGKSSILAELSPLPGRPNNYQRDGSKDVLLSHQGVSYRLISSFRSGNRHQFLRDGEELNPGGTAQVQRELVQRHFGITQELHDLLTGRTKFTSMAPMRRREWITQLSTADYSYALGIYNRLRSQGRDAQGAVKHLQQRLTQETNNLKSLTELDGLAERAQQLREELNALMTSHVPNTPDYDQASQRLDQVLQQVHQLSLSVMELAVARPTEATYAGIDDIHTDVTQRETELATTQALLDRSTHEYEELQQALQSLSPSGGVTEANVDVTILEVEQELSQLQPQIQRFTQLQDAAGLQQDNEAALEQIVEAFQQLPDNSDRRFSQEQVQVHKDRVAQARQDIDRASAQLSKIHARLTLIESAKDSTCPKCLYVWREGYSEQEVAQLQAWQQQHQAAVEQAEGVIRHASVYLTEAEEYSQYYGRFRAFVRSYPRLQPLWDYLTEHQLTTHQPSEHTGVFYVWRRDVELAAQIQAHQARLVHLRELSVRQHQLGGVQHFNQRVLRLGLEIDETTTTIHQQRQQLKDLRAYRDRVTRLQERTTALERTVSQLSPAQQAAIAALRNREIDAVVHSHQNELALIQRQLTERQALEGIVSDLERDSGDVALNQQALALLSQALSPTEGLIAEQLTGFIKCLTAQLNSVIAAVWTHDLEILPCGLESGELDYKFPFFVSSADNAVVDVSEGSDGQLEIFNFAFMLTVMLYKGLEQYPLYLDELGKTFDEQHRVNAMSFVKQLVDINHHSQMFMISHYDTGHGAFTNAEVLVLDGANIAVPGVYNQHAVLA